MSTIRDALHGYPEHIRQRVLEEFLTCVHPETEIIRVPIDRYDCYPEDDCPNLRELTVGSEKAGKQWIRAMRCFEDYVHKLQKTKNTRSCF